MYQRILVATDGSTLSKKAVNSAIAMAALTGGELVALKVVPRYPQSYFEGGLALQVSEVRASRSTEDGQAVGRSRRRPWPWRECQGRNGRRTSSPRPSFRRPRNTSAT
jgi:nucleotide-binding universal stress UspA family protein